MPGRTFLVRFLDGLQVCLCRPYLQKTPAGFGLERLATSIMNNSG